MHPLDAAFDETVVLHRAGQVAAALERYRQLITADPSYAKAWHLLGVCYHQQGQHDVALQCIARAIGLVDNNPVYYSNCGMVLRTLGRNLDAANVLRRAIDLDPNFADALAAYANALVSLAKADEAMPFFERALQLKPQLNDALAGLALAHYELGDAEASIATYRRLAQRTPTPGVKLLAATQLPPVYRSVADMFEWRQRLCNELDQLEAEHVRVDLGEQAAQPIFTLAHQGLNDRVVQRQFARLHQSPPLEFKGQRPLAARGKIHIGFCSSFFREHTIAKLNSGLIRLLNRDEFFVSVYSLGHHDDALARSIAASADQYVPLATDVNPARLTLAQADLDVLYYTDIGMDHLSYTLACSRLAPVQCVTWGHPVTTGIETVDYFVSSRLIEPPNAQEHYTERLELLEPFSAYFELPTRGDRRLTRADFGLADDAHLVLCPQSIYKFHPEFDAVLAGILRADPRAQVVLIRWIYTQSDDVLRARWKRTMADVMQRVQFVRRVSRDDFFSLLDVCDVVLDPLHFGGGNTSYEAFALGVPVVTLPGEFMRGRLTAGLYKQMRFEQLVVDSVEQYIEQAVRLAEDRDYRRECREQILAAQSRIFDQPASVRAHEDFFRRVAHRGS